MIDDPHNWRLSAAFGRVLVRHRRERNWTALALATSAGLSEGEVIGLEHGEHEPTLRDFFRIARALGREPIILFCDLVSAWRADPTDFPHKSRSGDLQRLFRLGYHHKPGDFRELTPCYYSVNEATHAAGTLNAQRHTRGVALLDTVSIYVRLDSVSLRPDSNEVTP